MNPKVDPTANHIVRDQIRIFREQAAKLAKSFGGESLKSQDYAELFSRIATLRDCAEDLECRWCRHYGLPPVNPPKKK